MKEAYKIYMHKDEVVLEDSVNKPSTNLLGADARGTVLGNDAHLTEKNNAMLQGFQVVAARRIEAGQEIKLTYNLD